MEHVHTGTHMMLSEGLELGWRSPSGNWVWPLASHVIKTTASPRRNPERTIVARQSTASTRKLTQRIRTVRHWGASSPKEQPKLKAPERGG